MKRIRIRFPFVPVLSTFLVWTAAAAVLAQAAAKPAALETRSADVEGVRLSYKTGGNGQLVERRERI